VLKEGEKIIVEEMVWEGNGYYGGKKKKKLENDPLTLRSERGGEERSQGKEGARRGESLPDERLGVEGLYVLRNRGTQRKQRTGGEPKDPAQRTRPIDFDVGEESVLRNI